MIKKYRLRHPVEAIQHQRRNKTEIGKWIKKKKIDFGFSNSIALGMFRDLHLGDYIVFFEDYYDYSKSEFRLLERDVFEATYEEVKE